ncbi:hypothetical protein M378DRAFT_14820 [Amanita muscaria Koide BX008]|uniref:P-loop containing nucleoside triphosphate hydrolase protein n=1 Tax=Amanita muscaria (strain Koide BX008) TaxID=946122 RepID=A0A0C2S995_AMAMK|nr:hypothetical protein M378DRAFT_14820 [Amanita muscaria Koide BX008]
MELDRFDEIDVVPTGRYGNDPLTVQQALGTFDDLWYALTYRRARWMDLMGDYAGNELFVLDGESLIEGVLDDPLLALGQNNDCGFQILHGYYILEQTLLEFTRRSANFEIIFWQAFPHGTLRTGSVEFVVSSRQLARVMLFKHLSKIDGLSVHVFQDLNDTAWRHYLTTKKPMFVMGHDGGTYSRDVQEFSAARILNKRLFLFQLLASGVSFARLNAAEYRESKILTFVNEQSRDSNAKKLLPYNFWDAAGDSEIKLATALPVEYQLQPSEEEESSVEHMLCDLVQSADGMIGSKLFGRELLFLFVLHCVLLPAMSAQSRARHHLKADKLSKIIRAQFLPIVFSTLAQLSAKVRNCVDVDGRVFHSVIRFVCLHHRKGISELLPTPIYSSLRNIWSERLGFLEPDFSSLSNACSVSAETVTPKIFKALNLLPLENDVFESELKAIKITIDDTRHDQETSSKYFTFGQGMVFTDDKHWHNQKSLVTRSPGEGKTKKLGYFARNRQLKRDQRFMHRLQEQAATLTGASGAILQQIVIAPAGARKDAVRVSKPQIDSRVNRKKEKKLSSADRIRLQIQSEKATKQASETETWWQEHLNTMSKLSNERKATYLKSLFKNRRSEEALILLEMQLYQLDLEFLQWIDEPLNHSNAVRDRYTVSIVRIIKDICDGKLLSAGAVKMLKSALEVIGFDEYIPGLIEKGEKPTEGRLSFKPIKLISSKTKEHQFPYMRIQEDPVLWQLRVFGEFMDRSMGSSPDPRVHFVPDAWQRKVLNNIDDNNSLLVVAPTSAGKTFISYYAMERVLRESDDGVLVYVAPTKALVTQVAAEVYARFSKTLKNGSCWAIHTRDYRMHEPMHCQILVTVPEIVATMLLSPAMARHWTPRIKWIILDEIHCIGQQEGGAVWEQILLFAPCPIIGLSATVGSPEIFNNWLETVQNAHGFKHTFVQHPHRYSHLRKFFYLLDAERKSGDFSGNANYRPTSSTRFLHPISMLSFGARSMPSDLALEARDTATLYQALQRHKHLIKCDLEALDPQRFFSYCKGQLLTQNDIIGYENALKEALSPLLASFDPADPSNAFHSVLNTLKDPVLATVPETSLNAAPRLSTFFHNLIYLVADLHAKDNLPAIFFSFDRTGCEDMLKYLLTTLEEAEKKWREESPEWQRKMEAWHAWQARSKERKRQAEREAKRKQDDGAERQAPETTWESSFNPKDPIEQFSFANTKVYSKAELEQNIEELSWAVDKEILRALRRGIAVHHAGMNKGYRSLVESLFRQRFIRVLISTGTLALGINAPAKTAVFVGDSPYLTALMYRQCSGRAGRRGYDLLGNVIFYGLTMDRAQRLVLSKLPTLGGNFPLTSTLVLRLCNLLHGSENAPLAVKAIRTILSLPSITFGSGIGKHQLLHHLRFSLEYLRQSHLIDRQGRPVNLYAIAAHLYYKEPSNLALIALMHSGVLHQICGKGDTIDARHDYILLMSHLFCRRYVPRIMLNSETTRQIIKKSPSMVVLPPLPKKISNVLKEHDEEVLEIFTACVMTYTDQHKSYLGPDNRLPLSGIQFTGNSDGATDADSPLTQYLQDTAIQVTGRSTFVANSGHDDTFKTVPELARTVRSGVYLNEYAIPSMTALARGGNAEHELNAYLLDFYTHGQTAALTKANGIRRNDVWYFLEDFALILALMKASLEQLFKKNAKAIYESDKESAATAGRDRDHSSEDESAEDDDDDLGLDSGYGTLESFGDVESMGEEGETADYLMKRPRGVSNGDWKVYEVVSAAREEFMVKFKAMWA